VLQLIFAGKTAKKILLKADNSVPYGFVAQCMTAVKEAASKRSILYQIPLTNGST
jgi:biopolymer transport protein ExbD